MSYRWQDDLGANGRKMRVLPPQTAGSGMPRYFFDIDDGGFHRDHEGSECANFEAARELAMRSLPEIARFIIPNDGDKQAFTVLVRDEDGAVVYTGTLTYAGLRLDGAIPAVDPPLGD